jgi:hypothetical protein
MKELWLSFFSKGWGVTGWLLWVGSLRKKIAGAKWGCGCFEKR